MTRHIQLRSIILATCCAALIPAMGASAATTKVRVAGGGLKFTPQTVTIQAGDTVEWDWAADGHSSTSGTPDHPDGLWDSGVQNTGYVFTHTFPVAGTFSYYCTPHGKCCGMIGSVIVTSGTQSSGAVFLNANSTSNSVWMYSRDASGQLTLVGTFPTQGAGSRGGLSSQGSITLASSNKFVYAVNAGSNDITGFQVTPTGLTFIGRFSSGGVFPNSVTAFGNYLYVLNARGTAANITGFTIQTDGSLAPIPGSTRPLSSALPSPAQAGFSPDGKTLIVSENGSNKLDTYVVDGNGIATGPTVQNSAGAGPFGFAFDNAAHLVVSQIARSSASSYILLGGILQVVSNSVRDFGKAACWVANTTSPSLPQQYSYVANTSSDSISGYAIGSNGSISLLVPNGRSAILPTGAFPLDMVISSDSQYLYVLEKKLPGIAGFQIQSDGSLIQVQDLRGTPTTSYGLTGY